MQAIRIYDAVTYDNLHTLAAEYNVSWETPITLAVERLLEDVKFVRKLCTNKKDWISDYGSFSCLDILSGLVLMEI